MRLPTLAALLFCAGATIVTVRADDQTGPVRVFEEFAQALRAADQVRYERYVHSAFAPSALTEFDPRYRADAMARLWVDTGGLSMQRVVSSSPQRVRLVAQAATGITYCVTLGLEGDKLTSVEARDFFPAGPSLTAISPRELARATNALARNFEARGELSGTILLAHGDQVLLRRSYGMLDPVSRRPVELATRFNVASIGKSFTAIAIARLVETGRLRLDTTVGEVLPDYPDADIREHVTVEHLLTHTSGLGPLDFYDDPRWPALRQRVRSVSAYMELVHDKPLGARPGERYEYSNAGYVILGAIIEKITRRDFYDVMAEEVFEPAGMENSSYPVLDAPAANIAMPLTHFFDDGDDYIFSIEQPRNAMFQLAMRGGPQGGAYSTADDLYAYVRAVRGAHLVGRELTDRMLSPRAVSVGGRRGNDESTHPGLGFETTTTNGHRMVGHQGGDLGVASFAYWFPDDDYTIVVLTNRDPRAARLLLNQTRALLSRRPIQGAAAPPTPCAAQ